MRQYIAVALLAYVCGSIPFGYILVRIFKKQDIRTTGSGNIGATNVARTAPGLGILTLTLDAFKGYFVAAMLPIMLLSFNAVRDPISVGLGILCVVLGHMFPVWLKFHGGKGVATAVGAYIGLEPKAVAGALVVFLIVIFITRYVSLASIVSAAAFPCIAFALDRKLPTPILFVLGAISVLIILKHHANIRRLLNGTENKFGRKQKLEAVAKED